LGTQFTRHAEKRLKERVIGKDEVESVLSSPEIVYFDVLTEYFVSVGSRTSVSGHWLIVVYDVVDGQKMVISVLDTSSVDKITRNKEAGGRWIKAR